MNKFCIVYDLETERKKRSHSHYYASLSKPFLIEAMVNFLEENPPPLEKKKLKQGVDLFNEVLSKADTKELKDVSKWYLQKFELELKTL